jgi:hypothetical protein
MPIAIEVARSTDWMTLTAAARAIERSPAVVMRLAIAGEVGYKREPGRSPLYSRADVERIAAQQRAGA